MPLERERFTVYLDDPLTHELSSHDVTVLHVDMLRGELEHNKQGLPEKGTNLNLVTAWCWAAMTRLGLYAAPFTQFRDMDCQGLEDAGKETVDPTQPGTTPDSA